MWKLRLITLGIGGLIFAYALYALQSGKVISTWARFAYRPSPIYWITILALLLIGGLNIFFGVKSFFMK